jgi:uncharacterized protein YutE (UPF0331/DUF86 family)
MLDKTFIKRKIKLIQEELSRLENLGHYTFEEIKDDFTRMYAIERALEKIIMRAIDINQHIIAETGKGDESIRGYEDTFYALSKSGIYSEDFAKEIAPSAGLRNRLVHEYNDTKDEIIYRSVEDAIRQYAKYCNSILKFIKDRKI